MQGGILKKQIPHRRALINHSDGVKINDCDKSMVPFITADHFHVFLDGTGKQFAAFVDSVIRAASAKSGLTPADVHTNLRVSVPDGGVDTQVDRGTERRGLLAGPTV